MGAWKVYSKDGKTERCELHSVEYGGAFMSDRSLNSTFSHHEEVDFDVFDYIVYRGEKFELESIPTVKKVSRHEYEYELRFVSLKYELERCEMRDLVPSDNGVVYPTPLTFSFTGDVRYLAERIQACLDSLYGDGVWTIVIAEGVKSEEKNITIAQQNCWNALALVNTTYGLNFHTKGRTITIGGEQSLIDHVFEYGKGNGLYEIERAADTDTGIVTKLRAFGGTRNLDYSYPKKPEWSDSVLPVSFAFSPLRLMLPSFKKDGKTDFVLADDATIAKYGIREASMVYDDIYPTITGATNAKGERIDKIKSVEPVDDEKSTFVIGLYDLGFDLEEHLTTSNAQISMKTGTLQGYTFELADGGVERLSDGGYKITLTRNSLESSEESGFYVPSSSWNMAAGDEFVLLNVLMPQEYIRDAEERLQTRAEEYLAQYGKTNFSYNIGLHDKFLVEHPSLYESLIEGSKLSVYDAELGISEEVTIQSVTITENAEGHTLPQVKVTLNNQPSASTLDRIQGQIDALANESAANNFTTQSEIMAQYRKKVDKPFFDNLFAAVDADGNEIPSNDVMTPIAYIKAKYHFATIGGVTMFIKDNNIEIPTIAQGLPFDGRTIWYNPETNQIEVLGGTGGGGGEGGGVSNFWDLNGIPSWITNSKPKYTYSEIEGTPDLTKYALASQIPSLSGYATESWVLQKNYATKATTLSGYGITDAYTKTNVDDLLKAYVTISGNQTITGEKNFTGGFKVNGSPIVYDATKKYWKLEGDLLVTGGVTMYGSDSSFVPSTIMDAISVDGTTISKEGGVLKVIGGTGGGVADSVAWNNITGKPNFASVATSGKYDDLIGKPTLLSSFTDDIVSGKYLPLSGGTISGNYGALIIHRTNEKSSLIKYSNTLGVQGYLGFNSSNEPIVYKGTDTNTQYKIWHTGNDGEGSGLDADKLDGVDLSGLLTDASSSSSTNLSITIGGVTKTITSLNAYRTDIFRRVATATSDNNYNLNDLKLGMAYSYSSSSSLLNRPSGMSYGQVVALNSGNSGALCGQLAWDVNHGSTTDVTRRLWWRVGDSSNGFTYAQWHQIAFTDSNVSSATKLETARTIWGQSFDGTNDVDGRFTMKSDSGIPFNIGWLSTENTVQMWSWASGTGFSDLCIGASKDTPAKALYFSGANGYWGIGTVTPEYKLHVAGTSHINGEASFNSSVTLKGTSSTTARIIMSRSSYNYFNYPTDGKLCFGTSNSSASTQLYIDGATGNVGIGTVEPSAKFHVKGTSHLRGTIYATNADATTMVEDSGKIKFNSLNTRDDLRSPYIQAIHQGNYSRKRLSIFQSNATNYTDDFVEVFTILPNGNVGIGTASPTSKLHVSGDILSTGAMTFYSMRKLKKVVDERGLSLSELSTIKPTRYTWKDGRDNRLHFGGIADDIQQVLPEVVYKTSEGILTMDYGNAAFAVASSLIKPVVDHEKRIAILQKRIVELEEEVERLKIA